MNDSSTSTTLSIPQLRSSVQGAVIGPDDAEYDALRTPFYGGLDARPAVIVLAADADDVAHVVNLARETGTELAIRSGGHSAAGHSTSEGGIVLDLRNMNSFDLDVENRTVWVEPGLTAVELTKALAEHELAIGFGDAGSVGIGGITVGGGVGFLSRKHGLTIDSLLAAEVVTADGRLRQVDADKEPDLFWALRGGGGNFGVITRLHFRLHEVGPIVGGMLILPAAAEVVESFIELANAAPEELSTIANVMAAPPLPFLPEEAHGKLVVFALMTYAGDVEAGEKAVAPFRELAPPLADMVKPTTLPEMYFPDEEGYHPTAVSRTMFIDGVDADVAATVVRFINESDAPMRVAQLRVLGGAIGRVPEDATAYAHRNSRIMVNVAAFYEGEADKSVRSAWGPRVRGRNPTRRYGRLRELHHGRGPGASTRGISWSDVGAARRDQETLRPEQPIQREPQHPAELRRDLRTWSQLPRRRKREMAARGAAAVALIAALGTAGVVLLRDDAPLRPSEIVGSPQWARKHYGKASAPNFRERNVVEMDFLGEPMYVHEGAERHFLRLANIFEELAPEYAAQIAVSPDDWSYSNRDIRGGDDKSSHAFGIALDINALTNVLGTSGDMPEAVVRQWENEGGEWGGDWSRPDPMHFETRLTPEEIRTRYNPDGSPKRP